MSKKKKRKMKPAKELVMELFHDFAKLLVVDEAKLDDLVNNTVLGEFKMVGPNVVSKFMDLPPLREYWNYTHPDAPEEYEPEHGPWYFEAKNPEHKQFMGFLTPKMLFTFFFSIEPSQLSLPIFIPPRIKSIMVHNMEPNPYDVPVYWLFHNLIRHQRVYKEVDFNVAKVVRDYKYIIDTALRLDLGTLLFIEPDLNSHDVLIKLIMENKNEHGVDGLITHTTKEHLKRLEAPIPWGEIEANYYKNVGALMKNVLKYNVKQN